MKEIWKDIKGYEGSYQVSSCGNVRSIPRYVKTANGHIQFFQGKTISQYMVNSGYMQVHLYKNNKVRRFYVHQLVANAFITNPHNMMEVNHKDYDKTNNKVSNLEWTTRILNVNNMLDHYGKRAVKICPICKGVKTGKSKLCLRCSMNDRLPCAMEVVS